jgi:hypothetical protein
MEIEMTQQVDTYRETGSRFYVQVRPRHLANTGPAVGGTFEVLELWSAQLYEQARGTGPDQLRGEGVGDTKERAVVDALVSYDLAHLREARARRGGRHEG